MDDDGGASLEVLERVTADLEGAAEDLCEDRESAETAGDEQLAAFLLGIEHALRHHADEARRLVAERSRSRLRDQVEESSRQSFPASDPPAY